MICVLVIFSYVGVIEGCNTLLRPRDVIYILDKSGSIGENNWRKQIEFLKNLTEHLDISINRTRVAALHHASKANLMFGIEDKTSRKEVLNGLDGYVNKKIGGNSKYYKALEYSLHNIFKSSIRHESRKYIIGLTDDMDNENLSKNTTSMVKEAEYMSIHIITICMKHHEWDCAKASTPGYNVSVYPAQKLEEALPVVINLLCPSAENTSTCDCVTNCTSWNGTHRTKAKIEELKDALKLDTELLSKNKRRKTSAGDTRVSSALIGYCSVSVLAIVGSWIVIPDILTLFNWILKEIRTR